MSSWITLNSLFNISAGGQPMRDDDPQHSNTFALYATSIKCKFSSQKINVYIYLLRMLHTSTADWHNNWSYAIVINSNNFNLS